MKNRDQHLVQVVPSERQLKHQQLEFYSFVHFSPNTFTDMEWGTEQKIQEILIRLNWMLGNGLNP